MPHSVAADEGVHGGLHKPRTHIRNEIDAVHTAALCGHQIPFTAGTAGHQHPVDDHTLLPEEGIERPHPVAGVEQVVHQDHRPAEGVDGADLALQRRVAGEVLNVEGGEVPGKDLVGVDGLGDGVGDSIAPQDSAEGYAHLGTQYPGHCGLRRDAVQVHNLPHQTVVNDLRVQGQDQRTRIQAGESPLHPEWAARTAASTVRSEEKGSFSVVGMFCSSTEGERISTSSRGFALGSSAGTKPCLSAGPASPRTQWRATRHSCSPLPGAGEGLCHQQLAHIIAAAAVGRCKVR